MNDQWNAERASQLLHAALAAIAQLEDRLSPARAEALLDEFEHEIGEAFLLKDLSAVTVQCEEYTRRFRALAEEG